MTSSRWFLTLCCLRKICLLVPMEENTDQIVSYNGEVQEAGQYPLGALCLGKPASRQTLSENGSEVWSVAMKNR